MSGLHLYLTDPQLAFMTSSEPYVDLEGAVRTGKTTCLCRRIRDYALRHPGIACALARWTQDSLDAQLRPRWREVCQELQVPVEWDSAAQCDRLPGGSLVYLRALKASEDTAKYGKLAGLTLAVVGIDQAEEVPEDVYRTYVPARLSQIGYPHQLLITPNPPSEDHWIASEWPLSNDGTRCLREGYRYLRTTLDEMRPVLGDTYVDAVCAAYPVGTSLYRRLVEGRRGLSVVGEPVYASVWHRDLDGRPWHVQPSVRVEPSGPVYESWDFGHRHPAVLWVQQVGDQWRVVAESQGTRQFLADTIEDVVMRRQQLGANLVYESVCDPAGAAQTTHALSETAVDVLHRAGIYPYSDGAWNSLPQRNAAIQRTAGLLGRVSRLGQPAVVIDARCKLFIDGCEAGYVWDTRQWSSLPSATIRRPLKDGTYDHLQNCWEYVMLRWGGAQLAGRDQARQQAKLEGLVLRRAQRDWDPYDAGGHRVALRGGYR